MAKANRRTSPDHETKAWPPGVPYIIGNEGCERFSYYGMRSILTVHLITLFVAQQMTEAAANAEAIAMAHIFFAGVYAFPMVGALIADRLVGKYNTILWLSLVYCAGHAVLAVGEDSITGMGIGLALIAVGSGGIKPCVSANVGDQFGKNNWFRVKGIFQAFYFIINFGSFFATLLIPYLRQEYSTSVAFGLPGVLMFIATVFFWAGRNKYVHVPARPGGRIGLLDSAAAIALFMTVGHLFVTGPILKLSATWMVSCSIIFLSLGVVLFRWRQRVEADDGFLAVMGVTLGSYFGAKPSPAPAFVSGTQPAVEHPLAASKFWSPAVSRFGGEATEATLAVLKVVSVFFLVSFFWALFEQHGSTWIVQAKTMNLNFMGQTLLPSQIAALNPIMVMILIPVMNGLYRLSAKLGFEPTSLRRMTIGMFMAGVSFVAVALIQKQIELQGVGVVSVGWQIVPYVIVTISEVMVSITGLEFAYTQAPKRMKSTIMGFWMLTVSLGQVLVALMASLKNLPPQDFFWIFSALMFGATVLFGIRARFYTIKDYTQ